MKKVSLIGLGLFTAFAAVAQTSVVKDVEHELKSGNPDYAKALQSIKPALTNAETANTMMPWYLAGKAGFGLFDNAYKQEMVGQTLSADQKKQAGVAYVDGYDYYLKALQLDSIPDEKGKIKPKKSKEILKTINGGYPYLRTAAIFLMQANDFDDAYNAWELYVSLPTNPLLGKEAPAQLADTLLGESMFYQANCMLASDQIQQDKAKVEKAIKKLNKVLETGYQNPDVYTYGIIASNRLEDKAMKTKFAQEGYNKYGTTDISFIGELINNKLDSEDYPGAIQYVDEAIASTSPDNSELLAQLYTIKGIIDFRSEDYNAAQGVLAKALEYNPNYGDANFYLAQAILQTVDKAQLENVNSNILDYKDDMLKAADLLKKAYDIDDVKYSSVPDNLYRIYYNLGADFVDESKYWESLR